MRAQAGDADGHSSSCGASERVAVLLLLRDAAESADAASFLQIASAVCIASMPAVVNSTDLIFKSVDFQTDFQIGRIDFHTHTSPQTF